MAKKQTSFADKAARIGKDAEATHAKYIKSVQSEKTGKWRFNEQMIRMVKGETLDAALKRMNEVKNLVDIDLTQFLEEESEGKPGSNEKDSMSAAAEAPLDSASPEDELVRDERMEEESQDNSPINQEVDSNSNDNELKDNDESSLTDEEE
tara:strand:- start:26 stop:478 length:453 start_codon:yes stop_codon:yes gene_type:complete